MFAMSLEFPFPDEFEADDPLPAVGSAEPSAG